MIPRDDQWRWREKYAGWHGVLCMLYQRENSWRERNQNINNGKDERENIGFYGWTSGFLVTNYHHYSTFHFMCVFFAW